MSWVAAEQNDFAKKETSTTQNNNGGVWSAVYVLQVVCAVESSLYLLSRH